MAHGSPHRTRSFTAKEKDTYLTNLQDVKSRPGVDTVRRGGAENKSPLLSARQMMPLQRSTQGGDDDREDEKDGEMNGERFQSSENATQEAAQRGKQKEQRKSGAQSDKRGGTREEDLAEVDVWRRRSSLQYAEIRAEAQKDSGGSGAASEDDDDDDEMGTELDGRSRGQRTHAQARAQARAQAKRARQDQPGRQDGGELRKNRGLNSGAGRGPAGPPSAGPPPTGKAGKLAECPERRGERAPRGAHAPWAVLALAAALAAALLLHNLLGARPSPRPAGPGEAAEPAHAAALRERLRALRRRFPSQCDELWRRVDITLGRHLDELADGDPTTPGQPATLLLASGPLGRGAAEGLARGIAAAYAAAAAGDGEDEDGGSAPAAETLSGAELSAMSGDEAKMEMDRRLQAALGGGGGGDEAAGAAAVLLRVERFPPASTLMLYAYCDHETAKFKRALIVFTVLLDAPARVGDGGDEAEEAGEGSCRSLRGFADRVYASLRRGLVGPALDLDKFAGLWSRVATVVLPVRPETSP